MDKTHSTSRRGFLREMAVAGMALGAAAGSGCGSLPTALRQRIPRPSLKKTQPAVPPGATTEVRRRPLGFYVAPLDPKLPPRLAWLEKRGVNVIGLDGTGNQPPEVVRQVARTLERSGMTVDAIHGVSAVATPDPDPSKLRADHLGVLERAAAWGVKNVVVHFRVLQISGPNYWQKENEYIAGAGLETYDNRVADFLAWLCREADIRRLAIAVESVPRQHRYGHNIEDVVAMVARVGASNLGVCLDVGHVHAAGTDPAAAFRIARKHLLTLHLHDNMGGNDPRIPPQRADLHLVPGLGTINWPSFICAMEETKYAGPAIFEGGGLGRKGNDADWEPAVEMTITNWRLFEELNARFEREKAKA